MPNPMDLDPQLEALRHELRVQIAALNELYHPVYPADPARVRAHEERVAELRAAIAARRDELSAHA